MENDKGISSLAKTLIAFNLNVKLKKEKKNSMHSKILNYIQQVHAQSTSSMAVCVSRAVVTGPFVAQKDGWWGFHNRLRVLRVWALTLAGKKPSRHKHCWLAVYLTDYVDLL